MIETYKPYILSQARRWDGKVDFDSKVAHGILGLWRALINAAYLGPNMRGYAKKYIKGHILSFLREERRRKTVSLEERFGNATLGQILGVND